MAQLTDEQMEQVRQWCAEGADLASIQDKLISEFEIKLTYLDTRMLLADLGTTAGKSEKEQDRETARAKEAEAEKAKKEVQDDLDTQTGPPENNPDDLSGLPTGGKASVSISKVTPPGMIVAGQVTFSDGKSSEWYLDQMGRLGMNPKDPEYKPSEADLVAFQKELQQVLKQQGF